MRTIGLVLVFLCALTSLRASVYPYPGAGARAAGLGYAFTGIRGDWGAIFFNPAGIGGLDGPAVGVYVEQRFLLRELTYGALGGIYPLGETQAVGIELRSFGFEAFRQNQVGVAYAITLLDRLSLGLKAKYAQVSLPRYGAAGVLLIDAGLHLQINPQLSLGFAGTNLNRARIRTALGGMETAPTAVQVGLSYRPTEELLLTAEVIKEEAFAPSFRGGLSYQVAAPLSLRIGVGSDPLLLGAGIGIRWQGLELDFAYTLTQQFSSPHLSLTYAF